MRPSIKTTKRGLKNQLIRLRYRLEQQSRPCLDCLMPSPSKCRACSITVKSAEDQAAFFARMEEEE